MDEPNYEPRAGVFRQQALEHLAEAHAIPGGVIPRVVPYLGWTLGIVTFAVAMLLIALSLIELSEQVSVRVVLPAPLDRQWVGQRFTAWVSGAERDHLRPGQLATVQFDHPGVQASAVVDSVSSMSRLEGTELRFEATLRFTNNPGPLIADRDQQVIVRVTTGSRSALRTLFGPGA